MGRTKEAAAAAPAATPAAPPSKAPEGVHVDEGGTPGSRPGPKAAAPVASGIPRSDVAAPVGQASAKDLNERQWDAKSKKLRDAVLSQAAESTPTAGVPVFGSKLTDEDVPDEDEAPRVGPKPVVEEKPKDEKDDKPKSTDATLAEIAAKDRENRKLRADLKKIADAPRGLQLSKLREIAKENPDGLAEALGIDVAELNLRLIAGKKGAPVKLEDDAPTKAEPTQAEKERDEANARAAAAEMREARRVVNEKVAAMVKDTKIDGKLRWHNVALIGDEAREAAVSTAYAFARGEVDEAGKRLETKRKMKPFSDEDATAVFEHFLDQEDGKWAERAKKLGAATQRPEPRQRTTPGGKPPRWKPRAGLDPNDPRNKPTVHEINEGLRERFFGARR